MALNMKKTYCLVLIVIIFSLLCACSSNQLDREYMATNSLGDVNAEDSTGFVYEDNVLFYAHYGEVVYHHVVGQVIGSSGEYYTYSILNGYIDKELIYSEDVDTEPELTYIREARVVMVSYGGGTNSKQMRFVNLDTKHVSDTIVIPLLSNYFTDFETNFFFAYITCNNNGITVIRVWDVFNNKYRDIENKNFPLPPYFYFGNLVFLNNHQLYLEYSEYSDINEQYEAIINIYDFTF